MADILERWFRRGAIWGTWGMLISAVTFLGYIVIGGVLTLVESRWAPEKFLSMTDDPEFVLIGTLVSLFVVQTTASLILYYLLTGFEDERSQFVLLMSYIGLGFGGAALRVFLPSCLAFLSNWL
ncbi:hypothetical protein [Halovenus sp. HT40]|uniref:hypothetical protein n=1 Tax=Halovenus sp. HT40 TaxID=3126691 RepID=UPI00300E91DB